MHFIGFKIMIAGHITRSQTIFIIYHIVIQWYIVPLKYDILTIIFLIAFKIRQLYFCSKYNSFEYIELVWIAKINFQSFLLLQYFKFLQWTLMDKFCYFNGVQESCSKLYELIKSIDTNSCNSNYIFYSDIQSDPLTIK